MTKFLDSRRARSMDIVWQKGRLDSRLYKHTRVMAVVFLLALSSYAKPAPVEDPEIVVENGIPVLRLPDSLIALIDTSFPGFRIPNSADLTGAWATWIGLGTVPYAVVGDFNGDGLTDVSLILISATAFKHVAFLKEANGYQLALDEGNTFGPEGADLEGPQSIYLRLIPKGTEFVRQGPTVEDTIRFTAEFDSIEFGVMESSNAEITFWKNGVISFLPIGSL